MTDVGGYLVLGLACVLGILLTAVRMPGLWLILLATGMYAWLTGWQRMGVAFIVVLGLIGLAAEVAEALMSAMFAHRVGASRRAIWGALIGGFLGLFIFSIPLPVIGSTIGAVLGCFLGALIGELTKERRFSRSTHVGIASALGCVLGIVLKIAVAFMMTGLVVAALVWD